MFSATEAERLIFTLIDPLGEVETISLAGVGCLGRVLAASVTSQLDFPHWDNSAMDGYAVRACDVEKAPTTLEVIEEIPAGKKPEKAVKAGQAARILTGAMLHDGADAVVMRFLILNSSGCCCIFRSQPGFIGYLFFQTV